MMDSRRDLFQKQLLGLFLFASPSTGSAWADALSYISEFVGNEVVQTLQTNSPLLADLDQRFSTTLNERLIPNLYGREACETKGYKRLIGKIVSEESAGRYFGRVEKLPETNHSTCVKPNSDHHPAHEFLLNCFAQFEKRFAKELPERRPVHLVCRRLQLSVVVFNEDGDAENEMSFEGISGVPGGKYKIPGARQGSGHLSEPQTVAERSSPWAEIRSEGQDHFVTFQNSPAPDAPADVTFRRISFNAYAMDARELRLKTGQANGVDWVQKRVDQESSQSLAIYVQMHPAMHLAGAPFVEVRRIGQQTVEIEESARLTRSLDYSPLLRTAVLLVSQPIGERTYRISWRLANPAGSDAAVSDKDLNRHEALVETLLWLRRCSEMKQPGKAAEIATKGLVQLLGECAGLVAEQLGGNLNVKELELSLMVVDDTDADRYPVLRMVHGSGIVEGSWNLTLAVGDGNAGRAVKKKSVRVFDWEKAQNEPLQYVYKPVQGRPPHRWLMSIPVLSCTRLVYAVLNIGTCERRQVRKLRTLEAAVAGDPLANGVQRILSGGLDLIRSEHRSAIDGDQSKNETAR